MKHVPHRSEIRPARRRGWRSWTTFTLTGAALVGTSFLAAETIARSNSTAFADDQTESGQDAQVMPGAAAQMAAARAAAAGRRAGELPSWDSVSEGFEQVISTADGSRPMYSVWKRDRDAQVIAELPRNYEQQLLFFAYTIAGGVPTAGVQSGDQYLQWRRYDRRLALIEPNFLVRSTGDRESQLGRDRVYTDRVVLDIPIIAQGPNGQPVINMTDLLLGQSANFFGGRARGANRNLAKLEVALAFPRNIELAWELPLAGGRLATLHYSISVIPNNTGYRPREADHRVGYFTTAYRDIGDPSVETPWKRYINRWHLEKAEPSLKLSPPREPIIFYIEHTTPVRYRRWVREGILEWNKAFEKVGIVNAIEVRQQDARTGAYMDLRPEDARYNFVLWTNAGMGFAIGPSRVDPRTGQILDADVVLDEGFISSWARSWRELIPQMAIENFGPETLAWLEDRPQWDPRVRLAPPERRDNVIKALQAERAKRGIHRFAGHPAAQAASPLLGENPYEGLHGRPSQRSGMCINGMLKSLDVALFRYGADMLVELAEIRYEKRELGNDPVSGTWAGSLAMPEMGEINLTMELTLKPDNSVVGSIDGGMDTLDVTGTFDADANKLIMSGEVPGMGPVRLEFDVTDDRMTGFAVFMGQRVPLSFRRTARPSGEEYVAVVDDAPAKEDDEKDDDENGEAEEKPKAEPSPREQPQQRVDPRETLDGMPESFVGPLLRDLTMHEIGHVLGLRHNFKASGIYSLEQINSPEHQEAGKTISGSVMDYNPINLNFGDGPVQGDYAMMSIGPYDYWAIEYGYSFERNLNPILKRVSEPELAYATDEDTWGPDPMARRFDLGRDPIDHADSQMKLIQHLRSKILEEIVKEGDDWAKSRRAYELLLARHFSNISMAANWIGGSTVHRDQKGDPGDRRPIENISAEQQRRALQFIIDNAFNENAFGLTTELLHKMTVEKWWDQGGFGQIYADPTWPVHDRIMGIQAAAMTMVMNPTTLNRVFDNEFRIESNEDALTLPEVIFGISDAVWSEIGQLPAQNYTARQPLISSLRRNLQSEHLKRLIDLSMPNARMGASQRAISNLSVHKLRQLKADIDRVIDQRAARLDPYTLAHLDEARVRVEKALEAQFIYNTDAIGGGGQPVFILLRPDDIEGFIAADEHEDIDW